MKNLFARSGSIQSYFLKLFELVLVVFAVFFAFFFFISVFSSIQGFRWMRPSWFMPFLGTVYTIVFPIILFIGCPLCAYFWYRKEVAGETSPERSHTVIRGAIRWGLAFMLIFYSMALFVFPLNARWSRPVLDDMTTSMMSSNYLFEYLLLRSQALRGILSGSLMFGGLLLFFRRTTIAGLVIAMFTSLLLLLLLLTVGNLDSIFGGNIIELYLLVATVYLMMLQWSELRSKLMGAGQLITPVAGMRFRWAMLVLVVALTGFIYKQSMHEMYKNAQLVGKWKVKVMERNGAEVSPETWMTDDRAWTTVYIDAKNELRFCANPFTFDQGASFHGWYQLDAEKGQLDIDYLRTVSGPVQFRVEGLGTNELSWSGKVGKDDVRLVLARDL